MRATTFYGLFAATALVGFAAGAMVAGLTGDTGWTIPVGMLVFVVLLTLLLRRYDPR